ncbi:MAG TPA: hypothetical protein DDW23_00555 [Planctomycetes bacterium]|nr:hypothetical protein [Planctomycetota bacterium]
MVASPVVALWVLEPPAQPLHIMRIRITLLATALTFAVGSVPALAAQQDAPLMWQSNGDTSFEGMGRRLYALDDFNGDSRTDIISVNPNGSSNLMTQNGVIRAISGTDGAHLWRIDGNYDFEQLGLTFPTIDDINGDGIRDLFALTSMGSTNGFLRNGFCRAISGADGSMMWQVFGMSDNEQFGSSYARSDDINFDNTEDIVVGSLGASSMGFFGNGYVQCVSANYGWTMWRTNGTGNDQGIGANVVMVADLNGDGKRDVIAHNPEANSSGLYRNGLIMALSGTTGQIIWQSDGAIDNARFGDSVDDLGDLNGDGISDLLVVDPDAAAGAWMIYPDAGKASLISGADGTPIWEHAGTHPGEHYGTVHKVFGDVNGDGAVDIVMGNPENSSMGLASNGTVEILSGANGFPLWVRAGTFNYGLFGAQLLLPGDLDGDGADDVLMVSSEASTGSFWNPLVNNGHIEALSGATGNTMWQVLGANNGSHLGANLVLVDDADGDGAMEIVSGSPLADENGLTNNGKIIGLSGRMGSPLWSTVGDSNDAGLGFLMKAVDDADGDGVDDLVSTNPGADSGNLINNGMATSFSSATGAQLWRYDGTSNDQRMGTSIVTASDVDFDGTKDVYVGAYVADTDGLADNGSLFCFSGGVTVPLSVDGLHPGSLATFSVTGGTPGATNWFGISLVGPGPTMTSHGIPLALSEPIMVLGSSTVDSTGSSSVQVQVPNGAAGTTFWAQAVEVQGPHHVQQSQMRMLTVK